jgi:hypothetical protein
VNPDSNSLTCQTTTVFYHLPIGWQVAASNAITKEAIRKYRWGTSCLIIADGTGWGTAKYSSVTCIPTTTNLKGNDFLGYGISGCSTWVFIQGNNVPASTVVPSSSPVSGPSTSSSPTITPSVIPSTTPTTPPTVIPSYSPSVSPTRTPSTAPTPTPTTVAPSRSTPP